MTETTREWLSKAEADLATARRECAATEQPNYDAVCFHAQQGIEKLMKALLIDRGVPPPRTHDLGELSRLISGVEPRWAWAMEDLRFLTRAAVDFRYPGESADLAEAAEALQIAERLRDRLRQLVG